MNQADNFRDVSLININHLFSNEITYSNTIDKKNMIQKDKCLMTSTKNQTWSTLIRVPSEWIKIYSNGNALASTAVDQIKYQLSNEVNPHQKPSCYITIRSQSSESWNGPRNKVKYLELDWDALRYCAYVTVAKWWLLQPRELPVAKRTCCKTCRSNQTAWILDKTSGV